MPKRPVKLSNSEIDFDRFSMAQSPKLIVTRVDTSSEEEIKMALNPRRGLRDLVAGRKEGPSKDVPKTQLPPNPTLPPSSCFPTQTCKRRRGREKRSRKGSLPHQKTHNSRKRTKRNKGRLRWRARRIL